METGREIAIRENELPMLSPAEVVQNATAQAKLLMDIVEQTKCYQQIRDKKYLQVEAWETIGAFNRTHAETESITPLTRDNETIGYQAHVQLWKDGTVVGGAIMPCYFTENACRGKEGDAKHKASMSAAQTFATSKAYRMNFSYVAILAGYAATPAEEMTGEDSTTPDHTQHHYCKEHDTPFFKRGKMQKYAHPIGEKGVDGKYEAWCNEPEKAPETSPGDVTSKSEPPIEESKDILPEAINLDWLKEQMDLLESKGITAYSRANVLSYLNKITGQEDKKVSDAVKKLTKLQAENFTQKIQDAVDMS